MKTKSLYGHIDLDIFPPRCDASALEHLGEAAISMGPFAHVCDVRRQVEVLQLRDDCFLNHGKVFCDRDGLGGRHG